MDLASVLSSHANWLMGRGGQRADLSGADLHGANLSYANLRGAGLRGAGLRGANLRGVGLSGADLLGADLFGANLRGANLRGANLRGADLSGANLSGANLSYIKPSWLSHSLISMLLARECETVEQWKVAGFIALRIDLCWSDFFKLNDPLTGWALSVLRKYETPDNPIPFKEVPNVDDRG